MCSFMSLENQLLNEKGLSIVDIKELNQINKELAASFQNEYYED